MWIKRIGVATQGAPFFFNSMRRSREIVLFYFEWKYFAYFTKIIVVYSNYL